MRSKRRYICSAILGELESFWNYKGFRVIFPKIQMQILFSIPTLTSHFWIRKFYVSFFYGKKPKPNHLNLTTLRHKVVVTFELVETFCYCEHSNESHWATLSCGTVYVFYQMLVLSFQPVDETLKVWPLTYKQLSGSFVWYRWNDSCGKKLIIRLNKI